MYLNIHFYIAMSIICLPSSMSLPILSINGMVFHTDHNISIQLCHLFNISLSECTCTKTPQLCHVEDFLSSYSLKNRTSHRTYERPDSTTIAYSFISLIVALLGFLGNAMVLIVSYYQRSKKSTSCRIRIRELAVVNLLSSLLQLINTTPLLWTNNWLYGPFMCKTIRTSLELGSFLTVGYIQIIAMHRYLLFVTPFKSHINSNNPKYYESVINMAICVVAVVPYWMTLKIEEHSGRCIGSHSNHTFMLYYNSAIVLLYVILPLCSLTVITFKMIIHVKNRDTRKLMAHAHEITAQISKKENDRIMYITLCVLLFFIVCTSPTRVITVYMEVIESDAENLNKYLILSLVSYFTYPLQNTLNPILYNMVAKRWRKDAKRLLLTDD